MSSIITMGDVDEPAPVSHSGVARIVAARSDLTSGQLVVLSDGRECTLVLLGSQATAASVARMIRDGSGLIFAAAPRNRLQQLQIPRMTPDGGIRTSGFHVAIDAASGISTGISAIDRAHTLRLLSSPGGTGTDFVRPGHVMPVAGDLTSRITPGTSELALALARQVDHEVPIAAYCALTSREDPRLVAGPAEGESIAGRDGFAFVSRDDVLAAFYRGR